MVILCVPVPFKLGLEAMAVAFKLIRLEAIALRVEDIASS